MAHLSLTGSAPAPGAAPPYDRARLAQWLIFAITAALMLAPALPILLQVFVDRPLYSNGWQFTMDNIGQLVRDERIGRHRPDYRPFRAVQCGDRRSAGHCCGPADRGAPTCRGARSWAMC